MVKIIKFLFLLLDKKLSGSDFRHGLDLVLLEFLVVVLLELLDGESVGYVELVVII